MTNCVRRRASLPPPAATMPAEDFTYEMRRSGQYVLPESLHQVHSETEKKEEHNAAVDPYDSTFTDSPASYVPPYNLWGETIDGDSLERQKTHVRILARRHGTSY